MTSQNSRPVITSLQSSDYIIANAQPGTPSLVPRPHFSCPLEKTANSIFVQVRQNASTLLFSNLTLDVIEDCIPHSVPVIY